MWQGDGTGKYTKILDGKSLMVYPNDKGVWTAEVDGKEYGPYKDRLEAMHQAESVAKTGLEKVSN